EPLLLGGARAHIEVAVERDDVPVAEVVAVIAAARGAGVLAEVPEVAARTGRVVIVVPGRRPRAGPVTPPGGSIVVRVVGVGAVRIGVVPGGDHRAANPVEQFRRELRAGTAAGDVARADEHFAPARRGLRCRRRRRRDPRRGYFIRRRRDGAGASAPAASAPAAGREGGGREHRGEDDGGDLAPAERRWRR